MSTTNDTKSLVSGIVLPAGALYELVSSYIYTTYAKECSKEGFHLSKVKEAMAFSVDSLGRPYFKPISNSMRAIYDLHLENVANYMIAEVFSRNLNYVELVFVSVLDDENCLFEVAHFEPSDHEASEYI